jgi:hypothetical protein
VAVCRRGCLRVERGAGTSVFASATPQLLHIGQWEFVDQTQPISNIAHGILDIRDSMSVQTNEKRALEIASAIAILESNHVGGADVNDPTVFYRMEANRVGMQIENPDQPVPPGYQTEKIA